MKAVECCTVYFASFSNLKLMCTQSVIFKYMTHPDNGQTVVNMSQCGFQ